MSFEEIGKIFKKSDHEIEWAIKDFFSYKMAEDIYESPCFEALGYIGALGIYLEGDEYNPDGWIWLCYCIKFIPSYSITAHVKFGVKTSDGTVVAISSKGSRVFTRITDEYIYCKLLEMKELLRRRPELVPSDVLTLTCTLTVTEGFDMSAGLYTLSKNLTDMFLSKKGCDVTLKVKEQTFLAHKYILSARSPVFAARFEDESNNTAVVDISDCHPDAFSVFLQYLYSGKAGNISSTVFELYRIADKYDVKRLKSDCAIYIIEGLSLENLFDAVIFGDHFHEKEVTFKSQDFFNKNFCGVVATEKWELFLKKNNKLANNLLKNMAPKIILRDSLPVSP